MAAPSASNGGSGLGAHSFKGISSISAYEIQSKLGEGTFGLVHQARSKRDGHIVALKQILMHNEKDGFPITALREIKLLKILSHPNVLRLEEMAIERPKTKERKKAIMYMVTPYMDHDLSGLLENPEVNFTEPQIKCYMLQLLEGIKYIHDSKILHRDMKAANLLINNRGLLQIADFGLARGYDESPPQPGRGGGEARREYTALVVTRWYRPPELLLSLRQYTTAIDLWGVGCVFGEMFKRHPILAGKSDLNQVQIIFDLVGSPTEETMPGWSSLPGCEGTKSFSTRKGNLPQAFKELRPDALSLLTELLKLDWRTRITAVDALEHPYFRNDPQPAKPHELPKYPPSHELDRRKFRNGQKGGPPPAPAGGTVGMGPNGEWAPGPGGHGGGSTNGGLSGPPSRDPRAPPGWMQSQGPESRGGTGPRDHRAPYSDHRRPQGPPGTGPGSRRPAWESQQRPDSLPQRPPRAGSARPEPAPANQRGPRGEKDTYIPTYSSARPEDRPQTSAPRRDDRDRDRDPRDRREERPHHRDTHDRPRRNHSSSPERPDRDRDRDRDPRDQRDRDRDRDRDRYADAREYDRERYARKTRSRSPPSAREREAERRDRERERDRERDRDKERDVYGRR